jgi:deoxycytidylate deaminase
MIINAGIDEIVVFDDYPDKMAMEFLKQSQVVLRKLKDFNKNEVLID